MSHIGLGRRHILLAVLSLAGLATLVATPGVVGEQVREGIVGVGAASPAWLWAAAAAFATSTLATSASWRRALRLCGSDVSRIDAAARYGIGSLVNAVTPMRVGTAVRVVLFSRTLPGEGRLWTAGGAVTAAGAVDGFWLAVLVAFAAAAGVLPAWPIALLLAGLLAAVAAVLVSGRWRPSWRAAHALDVFRAIGRCPRTAGALFGWSGLAMAARIAAAASVAAAFGIENPLVVAFLIVPAVDLAGTLPLTPGNIGVASAAVAFVLSAHGATAGDAISAGIAMSAVETLTSLAFGAASVLVVFSEEVPLGRRGVALVGAAGCAAVAGAFGLTVLAPLG